MLVLNSTVISEMIYNRTILEITICLITFLLMAVVIPIRRSACCWVGNLFRIPVGNGQCVRMKECKIYGVEPTKGVSAILNRTPNLLEENKL